MSASIDQSPSASNAGAAAAGTGAAGGAQPVRLAAVIGSGFMGGAIGIELALRVPQLERVRLWDAGPGVAERALDRAAEVARLYVQAGLLTADDAAHRQERLHAVGTMEEALDGAEYVAEAVPEDLAVKQETYRQMDRLVAPETVLASNTSGFDPAALAQDLSHPERVLVAHYFGPAYLIPLVEVLPHPETAEWAVQQTLALLGQAGKHGVRLGRFAPGFVANRLQQALFREALFLLREGIASPEAIDDVVRFSFAPRLAALGPFNVADFAGLDVYASIIRNIWPTLSNETAAGALPPEVAARLEAGRLGTKTSAGFYDWPADHLQQLTARRDSVLLDALRQQEE